MKRFVFFITLLVSVILKAQSPVKHDYVDITCQMLLDKMEDDKLEDIQIDNDSGQVSAPADVRDSLWKETGVVKYYCPSFQEYKQFEIIQIHNDSDEDYYTWISDVPIEGITDTKLVNDLFWKSKGDFSFDSLIGDCTGRGKTFISVGFSFIARICAGQTFSYMVEIDNGGKNPYIDRIVVLSAKEVIDGPRGVGDPGWIERWLYSWPVIYL